LACFGGESNWLIGSTDAHAKNYSILIGAGGRVRLAPLYEMAEHPAL
jgi:serine/threonine-protein kinase HipA